MQTPTIQSFFDPVTFTVTHVVSDPNTRHAVIIDSVLDFDPKSGRTSHTSAEKLIAYVRKAELKIDWILETHAHADHLSAAIYLKQELGGRIAIGRDICKVQTAFKQVFNATDMDTSGADFDRLLDDGEVLRFGSLEMTAIHTPGHTPACMTFVCGSDAFVGDTLFMPDYGSARCDFPGGDAATLFQSIQKILALDPSTRLHMCHDYPPAGRAPMWTSSVAAQRKSNIHVHDGVTQSDFVSMRQARDKNLDMPVLILPSVQVNVRAGKLPPAEDNGVRYLKLPLNLL